MINIQDLKQHLSLPDIRRWCGTGYNKDGEEVLISDEVEAAKINPNSVRKANEDHIVKMKMWLPIRSYNYRYALSLCNDDHVKAIAYVKEHLTGLDQGPIYLPDRFEELTGTKKSYTKIMMDIDEKHRNQFNN